MDDKTHYIFRAEWLEGLCQLPPMEELILRRMIDEYAMHHIEPSPLVLRTCSEPFNDAWESIQQSLNLSYIRSQAGKKGGHHAGYGIGNQHAKKTKQNEAKNEAKRSKKTKQNEANLATKTKQNEAKGEINAEKRSKTKQNSRARVRDSNNNNNLILPPNSVHAGAQAETSTTQAFAPYLPPSWVGHHPPSEEEVLAFGREKHIKDQTTRKFYNRYSSQNWTYMTASGRPQPICDWKRKLLEWQIDQEEHDRKNSTTNNANAGYAGRTRQLAEQTMQILRQFENGEGPNRDNDILFD